MLENGSDFCNCKKTSCIRYGKCSECIEYHKDSKNPPYCKRPKSSHQGPASSKKEHNNSN